VHVFWAQTATAALRASLLHKHSEVRFVAQVDLGSSCMKHASYTNRLDSVSALKDLAKDHILSTLACVPPKTRVRPEPEQQP